jgi:Mor family transcriptional regulator
MPKIPVSYIDRNSEIYERHLSGESFPNLAKEFSLSKSRIYQIFHREKNKRARATRQSSGPHRS